MLRSILAMSTMLLFAGPALASYQGTQGGNSGAGVGGGPPGHGVESGTGRMGFHSDGRGFDRGITTMPGGRVTSPRGFGIPSTSFGRGGVSPRGGDPDDGAPGVGHDGISGNSNSPDGPGSGNGK